MIFGALFLVRRPFKSWQLLLVLFAAIEPAYHFVAGPDSCLTMLWMVGMTVSFSFYKRPDWFTPNFWNVTDAQSRRACFMVFISCVVALLVHRYAATFRPTRQSVLEFQTGTLLAGALFPCCFCAEPRCTFQQSQNA